MSGHSTIVGEVIRMVVNCAVLSWRHTVVSLPCTISSSAVIYLKESNLVVTQPGRTSRRLNMVISSVVISTLLNRYSSEPEKQQFTTVISGKGRAMVVLHKRRDKI
ncbi:hypothetical protein MTR_7g101260 [Medicago truncatula]|uniref:Uncharacterized protein n=1 Tax=Medicago truncatula TaxID=3880 RepID=G7L2T7_MEDTR|nr:hypothetical protein MTR_7g101260 [Medicago truncatula]